MSFINTIPVLRVVSRFFERRNFVKRWRKLNSHNETKVGERFFPIEVARVGKGSYGTINVYSLYVTPQEKLDIGNYVSIAPDVIFFLGMNHQISTATTFPFYSKLIKRSAIDAVSKGPLVVEDEVWIGTGTRIFSGVRIGKGAIVAAGSIVTKDVPPYAVVGGNPAKIIRYRFKEDVITILKPIYFVNFSDEWIKQNIELIYKKIETVEDALALKAAADSYPHSKHE